MLDSVLKGRASLSMVERSSGIAVTWELVRNALSPTPNLLNQVSVLVDSQVNPSAH